MADLYRAFGRMSEEPQIGELRLHRSFPFLMAPAKQHFAVYKPLKQGIIIATVLHGRRNIESILRNIGPSLAAEIAKIEKQMRHMQKSNRAS
ncbi:MAG: hypothetical protein BECKG1743F_GA0114225_101368 [Candidatus Kentron sp. G]|nr:MAG: hypothetical protein BECKG1743F_GA0114225_101368 [Candidatus Kentron sp. G]